MKVAIISSYKIRCGIASFTETLVSLLGEDFDIEVLPLDQFALRSRHPRVRKLGDQEIDSIGARLREFDVINLQWEPGLLGLGAAQSLRRMKALFRHMAAAGKPVIVTAHTAVEGPAVRSPLPAVDPRFWFARRTQALLRELDGKCRLTVIAHTARDRAFFEYVVGLKNVVDHPLSHMRRDWPTTIAQHAPAFRRRLLSIAGPGKTLIGVFGFLGEYKGVEIAIRALRNLPDKYALMIFGEVHPENLWPWMRVHPYIARLMRETGGDFNAAQTDATAPPKTFASAASRVLTADARLRTEISRRKRPLTDRVFFMGSPDDFEFALAVQAMDVCVFPYLEVGQSASGPVSHAIELQKNLALARTKTFTGLEDYYPESLNFFDIGNELQLAQLIERLAGQKAQTQPLRYDSNSLRKLYSGLFGRAAAFAGVGA